MKQPTKCTMGDEIGDGFLVGMAVHGYAEGMFATKPATPSLEFDELARAFDRATLATLFDRDPDTIGRWRQAGRVPHTVEMVVDRFWWVMHVAYTERAWPLDRTRYFLLSIEPQLGRRPADLVRESDEQARTVVELIAGATPPDAPGAPEPVAARAPAPESPFAALLAVAPDDDTLTRAYRAPTLAGRSRPIGGLQEQADPFTVHYTTRASHAIPLGASAVGV
jgi:hypothetical protein